MYLRADELAVMVIGLIILSFFVSANVHGAEAPSSVVHANVALLVEQAQKLTLNKKRREAAKLLNDAIESNPTLKNKTRLIEAVRTISTTFLTDRGQRLFESGQSAMFDSPDVAMSRYREALAIESENTLILNSIAHLQLGKDECSQALETISQARSLSPFIYESALLELRALICQKNFEAFRLKLKVVPSVEKAHEYFVSYLLAQDLFQQKLWKKGTDLLLKVSEEQPRFPEAYYWLNKANAEQDKADDSFAKKYLALCKTMSVRDRKKYAFEPRLCGGTKEVQDELQNQTIDE